MPARADPCRGHHLSNGRAKGCAARWAPGVVDGTLEAIDDADAVAARVELQEVVVEAHLLRRCPCPRASAEVAAVQGAGGGLEGWRGEGENGFERRLEVTKHVAPRPLDEWFGMMHQRVGVETAHEGVGREELVEYLLADQR